MYTLVCAFDRISVRQDNSVRDNRLVLIHEGGGGVMRCVPRTLRRVMYHECNTWLN